MAWQDTWKFVLCLVSPHCMQIVRSSFGFLYCPFCSWLLCQCFSWGFWLPSCFECCSCFCCTADWWVCHHFSCHGYCHHLCPSCPGMAACHKCSWWHLGWVHQWCVLQSPCLTEVFWAISGCQLWWGWFPLWCTLTWTADLFMPNRKTSLSIMLWDSGRYWQEC